MAEPSDVDKNIVHELSVKILDIEDKLIHQLSPQMVHEKILNLLNEVIK